MKTIRELMNMAGRVAAITGGAGHIGLAIAGALAETGAQIVLIDRHEKECREAATAISDSHGVQTLAMTADLSREDQVVGLPAAIAGRFGRLDVLVNCAAFVGTDKLSGWSTDFGAQSAETWRACLEVNLTSAFLLAQKSAPLLTESGHGAIINVASIYGLVGPDWRLYEGTSMGNPAAYAASKGGLLQLTRWLSTTLSPSVRVNSITPGGVWRNQDDTFFRRYVSRVPLGRMAMEEDIKGAALYLASDLSAYVTGQNLIVDGGWTAW